MPQIYRANIVLKAVTIGLAGVVGCLPPQLAPSFPDDIPVAKVLQIVQDEVRHNLQEPIASEFSERSLVVVIENDYVDRFRLFRVTARGIGHGERFVIASIKSDLYKLAGFRVNELTSFAKDAELFIKDDTLRLARLLTFLADPNGSGEVLHPSILESGATIDPGAEMLLRGGMAGCDGEAITVAPNGISIVRMIAVSRAEEWHPVWRAYCYQFTFNTDGHLVEWARESGPRVPIR
jgi:hypothetical protein